MSNGWQSSVSQRVCRSRSQRQLSACFDVISTAINTQVISTPERAPRANAIAERFVGNIRRELLDRILIRLYAANLGRQVRIRVGD